MLVHQRVPQIQNAKDIFWLVVEPTPLKNMTSSVGMMTFPTVYIWKVKKKSHGSKPPSRF